jgi:hypothetical protein
MKACIPGEGMFKDLPPFKTYEWYLEALKKMQEEQQDRKVKVARGNPVNPVMAIPSVAWTRLMIMMVSVKSMAPLKKSPRSD